MNRVELIAPCHFGLEAVLKREIQNLGYEITRVEDGRVTFAGDISAVCRANIFLRSAERILLKCADFTAVTYDELYEKTRMVRWSDYLPRGAKCWVAKASSIRSRLFSPSDIQSIIKKAIVDSLMLSWNTDTIPETGPAYPLRVFVLRDEFIVGLDTTGESLHKRGYRTSTVKAPISETLAAPLLMLTHWNPERPLVDPFCGSGTFPIEAALMAAHIAPGINRDFLSEDWDNLIDRRMWYQAVSEAQDLENHSVKTDIEGYDIDPECVAMASENAERAGVADLVKFGRRPVAELSHSGSYGVIITNPPYGERLENQETLPPIYRALGIRYSFLDKWSMYLITSYKDAEKMIGRRADRNRKIYNGMIQTYFYIYEGPRPPRGTFSAAAWGSGRSGRDGKTE
ncbi:MAG: THUMP domain-containing class I SAM-dependent RNA methyltransferase [Lachnospiraceae bacterium]|jgi:putative N6-adenine-specific DNA methylase